MQLGAVIVVRAEHVELLVDLAEGAPVGGGGVFLVEVDDHADCLLAVGQELAAEHFGVFGSLVHRVGARVVGDDGVAVGDPLEEAIVVREGQGAGGVEQHDAVVLREGRRVELFLEQLRR